MPHFNCARAECDQDFYSKHSTAKYCGRRCAGLAKMATAEQVERHRTRMLKYSEADLLTSLLEQADQLGRTPARRELHNPSEGAYRRRFGSYTNAVIAAGLPPNTQVPTRTSRSISPRLRFFVLQRDRFTCQYCGGTPQQGYTLEVDHQTAVSNGGKTVAENLITACWECNSGKSDSQIHGAVVQR